MPAKPSFRLWTPIANAVDAFRRRLIAEPGAVYEHIWRLLHIEESLVVLLGATLASRLRYLWENKPDRLDELNHLRKMVTGLSLGGSESSVAEQNSLTGSIDAWINILQRYGKPDTYQGCPFCVSVGHYLTEELEERIAFVDVWGRVAPVPEVHKKDSHSRLERIRAMNGFRNKLAHVPISHKVLNDVYRGIRLEVIRLLSPDEKLLRSAANSDISTRSFHDVLRGALGNRFGYVTGSDYQQIDDDFDVPDGDVWYQWSNGELAGGREILAWNASPFVQIDAELKVLLLFRVSGLANDPDLDEFQGEYHRFAAEIEPVRQAPVTQESIRPWFPTEPEVDVQEVDETSNEPTHEQPVTEIEKPSLQALSNPKLIHHVQSLLERHAYGDARPALDELFGRGGDLIATSDLRDWADEAFRDRAFTTAMSIVDAIDSRGDSVISSDDLRSWAQLAMRDRAYDTALRLFDALAASGDSFKYNDVAKLMHGSAMREVAVRNEESPGDRKQMLQNAIQLLDQAAGHVDPTYSARALYQESKALWHLWHIDIDQQTHKRALSCANRAVMITYDPAYVSWFDRLQREADELEEQAV